MFRNKSHYINCNKLVLGNAYDPATGSIDIVSSDPAHPITINGEALHGTYTDQMAIDAVHGSAGTFTQPLTFSGKITAPNANDLGAPNVTTTIKGSLITEGATSLQTLTTTDATVAGALITNGTTTATGKLTAPASNDLGATTASTNIKGELIVDGISTLKGDVNIGENNSTMTKIRLHGTGNSETHIINQKATDADFAVIAYNANNDERGRFEMVDTGLANEMYYVFGRTDGSAVTGESHIVFAPPNYTGTPTGIYEMTLHQGTPFGTNQFQIRRGNLIPAPPLYESTDHTLTGIHTHTNAPILSSVLGAHLLQTSATGQIEECTTGYVTTASAQTISGDKTFTGTITAPIITTNTTNIATNAGDILTNTGNITTNAGDILTNTGNITTNTTNIATNAGDILTNTGNITTNTTNIATNTTNIATNATNIATNTTNIATNTTNIATKIDNTITTAQTIAGALSIAGHTTCNVLGAQLLQTSAQGVIEECTTGFATTATAQTISGAKTFSGVSTFSGDLSITTGNVDIDQGDLDIQNGTCFVSSGQFGVAPNTAPSSATDTGDEGQIIFTADYIYYCTATNTWKRTALSTW